MIDHHTQNPPPGTTHNQSTPRVTTKRRCSDSPRTARHNYPVGTRVMYHTPPKPGCHTVWYPAKIKTHLKEPRAYLLEDIHDGKIIRCTEQHMRPYTCQCHQRYTPRLGDYFNHPDFTSSGSSTSQDMELQSLPPPYRRASAIQKLETHTFATQKISPVTRL